MICSPGLFLTSSSLPYRAERKGIKSEDKFCKAGRGFLGTKTFQSNLNDKVTSLKDTSILLLGMSKQWNKNDKKQQQLHLAIINLQWVGKAGTKPASPLHK